MLVLLTLAPVDGRLVPAAQDPVGGRTDDHDWSQTELRQDLRSEPRFIPDLPADTTTTINITVGENITGLALSNIDSAGDEDWFRVQFVPGTDYRIAVEWYSGQQGNPVLSGLYDADGTLIPGTRRDDGPADLACGLRPEENTGLSRAVRRGAKERCQILYCSG